MLPYSVHNECRVGITGNSGMAAFINYLLYMLDQVGMGNVSMQCQGSCCIMGWMH